MRQLRKRFDDHGLAVVALRFGTRRGYDVADDLDRRIEATKAAMSLARDLGATLVTNHVGRVDEKHEGPSWEQMIGVLHDLGAYGHKVGAMLAAHNVSESAADMARLVAAMPEGYLGVALDPGAMAMHSHSAVEAVQLLSDSIVHVYARDGVRDAARGRGLEVELGRGSVDFPALLGALEERSYRGYLAIDRQASDDPLGEAARAIRYLRSL